MTKFAWFDGSEVEQVGDDGDVVGAHALRLGRMAAETMGRPGQLAAPGPEVEGGSQRAGKAGPRRRQAALLIP